WPRQPALPPAFAALTGPLIATRSAACNAAHRALTGRCRAAPMRLMPGLPGDSRTLDREEVDRFARLASEWWDPTAKFRALHRIGPARLTFLRDQMVRHFGLAGGGLRPLVGLRVLDVGCGGGLICEPLARLGA